MAAPVPTRSGGRRRKSRHGASGQALEPAVTIEAYIESEAAKMTAAKLKELALFAPMMQRKLALASAAKQTGFVEVGTRLLDVLASTEVRVCRDPLPADLAEAGVAANYLLKGADVIPDNVPDIGFADDEIILRKIFARNPALASLRGAR